MLLYPAIDDEYSQKALELFRHQAMHNTVYKSFLGNLGIEAASINKVIDVPFLPISLFKSQIIKTGEWKEEEIFLSSGTTQQVRSKHYIKSAADYLNNTVRGFESLYGSINDWTILAYLPGYTENPSSSLIHMVEHFIGLTQKNGSRLIPFDEEMLLESLAAAKNKTGNQKTLLIGVSHALLDFVETNQIDYPELIVMETGGMKGMKQELTKAELHNALKKGFGVDTIHSEYGMTELSSQAYSKGEGIFYPTRHLRLIIKDPTDPFETINTGRNGVIHVIDLANKDSCAFIATEDLGKIYDNGSFELLGRMDVADARGCNLLYYS